MGRHFSPVWCAGRPEESTAVHWRRSSLVGLDDKHPAKSQEAWLDLRDTASVKLNATFSQREMQRMEKAAAARNTTVQKMVDEEMKKVLDSLKK